MTDNALPHLQSYVAALVDQGTLTLSFRGSVSEISVRLLAKPETGDDYLEGCSTMIDRNAELDPLSTAFYMAMHGLITNHPDATKPIPLTVPDDILGKEITILTRPARRENMTGSPTPESISVRCADDAAIYMDVVGQDFGFPSKLSSLIYRFPLNNAASEPAHPTSALEMVTGNLIQLLQTFGTPLPR